MPSRPFHLRRPGSGAYWLRSLHVHRGKPVVAVRTRATHDAEELLGKLMRDRPGLAILDQDTVDRADGCDLSRGAGEEDLVRDVEDLARERLVDHRYDEMACARQ